MLGVCGGIAAYKAVEVCRRLVDAGVHVTPVLTEDATRFVGAVTFSALASEPAQRSLWDESSPIPHTRLGQRPTSSWWRRPRRTPSPATPPGLADDLLCATLLATRAPVIVCPAMHTEMWEHASVRDNLATLVRRGVEVMPPESGRLAGGDSGEGRLADPAVIVGTGAWSGSADRVAATCAGLRVVVSAGGTREPLDPVRFITNRSSGKQGHALAVAAARRGAGVTLVRRRRSTLPHDVALSDPGRRGDGCRHGAGGGRRGRRVRTWWSWPPPSPTSGRSDRPAPSSQRRTASPRSSSSRRPTSWPAWRRAARPGQVLVGFAAETHDALERGRRKLERKGVDLLVVNDVSAPGAGFDHDTNAVVDPGGGRGEPPKSH